MPPGAPVREGEDAAGDGADDDGSECRHDDDGVTPEGCHPIAPAAPTRGCRRGRGRGGRMVRWCGAGCGDGRAAERESALASRARAAFLAGYCEERQAWDVSAARLREMAMQAYADWVRESGEAEAEAEAERVARVEAGVQAGLRRARRE